MATANHSLKYCSPELGRSWDSLESAPGDFFNTPVRIGLAPQDRIQTRPSGGSKWTETGLSIPIQKGHTPSAVQGEKCTRNLTQQHMLF